MTNTATTHTVEYDGETIEQTKTRTVTHAAAFRNYHGEVVVVLSKDEATAGRQLKRDLSSGYAVRGTVVPL